MAQIWTSLTYWHHSCLDLLMNLAAGAMCTLSSIWESFIIRRPVSQYHGPWWGFSETKELHHSSVTLLPWSFPVFYELSRILSLSVSKFRHSVPNTLLSHFKSNSKGNVKQCWNQFTTVNSLCPKRKLLLHDENPVWKIVKFKSFFSKSRLPLLQVVSTSYALAGKSNIYLTDRTYP